MAIDLRSDTVTKPTPAMREAMARAEVGDDVYGEDPTVIRLEAQVAGVAGMDAAVFVASGTMGNLASVLAHCQRGQEAIVGNESHIFHYEAGGSSALGGVVLHAVETRPDGTLPVEAIAGAIRSADNLHFAPAGVIALENTHNRCGGVVLPPAYFAEVAALAEAHHLPVHLDGARIFNAAVATGLPVTDWTRHVTSIQLCLSKGLGAPVGSVVAGPAPFVGRVRRVRKMLGGGMRQAGVLAAAGLVALDHMVDRLATDHANARLLAEELSQIPGVAVDLSAVQTNIVIFRLAAALDLGTFLLGCRSQGVLLTNMGNGTLRAVTHADVTLDECRHAVAVARTVLSDLGAAEKAREDAAFDALRGRR
jgi:threonine aldolase